MTGFIFCLIFIQVAIFLGAGIVLFSTFFFGITREAAHTPEPEETQNLNHFDISEARLTRSEVEFLLAS